MMVEQRAVHTAVETEGVECWGRRCFKISRPWRANRENLGRCFRHTQALRRLICITNAFHSFGQFSEDSIERRWHFHESPGSTEPPPYLQMRQWRIPLPFPMSKATFSRAGIRMLAVDQQNSKNLPCYDIAIH